MNPLINPPQYGKDFDTQGVPRSRTGSFYAEGENSKVLVIEKSVPGGQAGVTERLDNYPGFPEGVGGADLANRITLQAQRFGVEILQAASVTAIQGNNQRIIVTTSIGEDVMGKAVLISTGSTYRRTGAEGEANLIGAGNHFCATCDGPFYKGAQDLVVVGGGNSGLEEGLFLTQFADRITIVQSRETLSASRLLQEKVMAHPKMRVITGSKVASFNSDSAGDVREGSTKQLASAVGEGAAAAIQIRYHLDALSIHP